MEKWVSKVMPQMSSFKFKFYRTRLLYIITFTVAFDFDTIICYILLLFPHDHKSNIRPYLNFAKYSFESRQTYCCSILPFYLCIVAFLYFLFPAAPCVCPYQCHQRPFLPPLSSFSVDFDFYCNLSVLFLLDLWSWEPLPPLKAWSGSNLGPGTNTFLDK